MSINSIDTNTISPIHKRDRSIELGFCVVVKQKMSSSGKPSGEIQIVSTSSSTDLVEYTAPPVANQEEEDIEVKLRRIIDCVPVRVNNTSGSSAGSGSGDFHQYRQMRRREQDRVARMDVDFQKRKQVAEFNKRREERLKATEERTAKKRLKRQKKKQKKQEKKMKVEVGNHEENSKDDDGSENEDEDHDSGNEE